MKYFIFIFAAILLAPLAAFAPSHPEYVGFAPPLKQLNAGIPLLEVKCNEGLHPAYKSDVMRVACVSLDTESQLIKRGWALLRVHMYDMDPAKALCERYDGDWISQRECEYISPFQCSLIGGEFSECESACRHDPNAEACTLQCVPVCSIDSESEFSILFTKQGGIAGINQKTTIDSITKLITIDDTTKNVSEENIQILFDTIIQQNFFEITPENYPPQDGWADYFTYSIQVTTQDKSKSVSWTDASEFPEELEIILQEIQIIRDDGKIRS